MQLTGSLKYLRNKSVSPMKHKTFILNQDMNEQNESSKSSDAKSTLHLTHHDIEKLINEKYNKIVMSDVQKEIILQSQQIDGLVGDIDKNRKDLMVDIEIINEDLTNFQKERVKKGIENEIPGQAIYKLLKAWSEEPTQDNYEIYQYSQELWLSLNQFEKQIQNEERGYQMKYDIQQQRYKSTIEQLKQNSSARIQALESALIECKLKYKRQIDRLNMQICEKESVILNQHVEQQAVDDLVKMIDNGIRIKSVQEARTIINQLNKIVKSKQFEVENLNFQMDAYKKVVDNYEDRIQDREFIYLEERKIRQYYQKILMKMARDLNLFKNNKNKLRIFNSLNEMDSDLNYQRQVVVMLKEIEIKESIDNHVNIFLQFQQKEGEISSFLEQTQNIFTNYKNKSEKLAEKIEKNQESQLVVAEQKSLDKKQKGLNQDNEQIDILKQNFEKLLNIQKKQYQEVENEIKDFINKKESLNIVATKNSGQFNQEFKREYRKEIAFMIQNINQQFLEDFRFEKARILESNAEKAYQKSEESSESFDNQQTVQQNKNQQIKAKQSLGNAKYQNLNLIKKQNNVQEIKEPAAPKKFAKSTKKKEKFLDEQLSSEKVSLSSDRSRLKIPEFNNEKDLQVINEESQILKQKNKKQKYVSQPPQKSIKKSQNKKSVKIHDNQEDNTLLQNSQSESLSSSNQEMQIQSNEQPKAKDVYKQKLMNLHLEDSNQNLNTDFTVVEKIVNYEKNDFSLFNSNEDQKKEENDEQNNLKQEKKNENIRQKSKLVVKNKISSQKTQNISKKDVLLKKSTQIDEISKQIQQVTQKKNNDKDSQKSNDIFNVGVAKVHKQLQALFQKKYSKLIEDIQPFNEEEFGDKLKMNAFQVTQLQNEIQQAMQIKFNHDTLMRVLYKANILQFFEAFNSKIMETYQLNQCVKVYKNGGNDQDRQNRLSEMTLKEKKNFLSKEIEDLQKVQIGNLIFPHFSFNGELKGFELRHQLISMMFMNNKFDFNILKRAIKAVCYMNRIVCEGAEEDLVLINQNKALKKDTQDKEIQVNALELKANRQIIVEQEVSNADPAVQKNEDQIKQEAMLKAETVFINMLKSHLVKVMSRTDFETQKYYKVVIDEMTPDELLNYEMEGVFINHMTMLQDQNISFENYLFSIFSQVRCIVESIPDEQSKKLRINQVLFLNPDYSKAVERTFANQEVQAVVKKAVKSCLTGNELLTAFFGEKSKLIVRYSQNQLIIDKLMEEEFQKTMKIMDEFAQQIQKLEQNTQKKVINQIKKEQYLLKTANIFQDDHELQQLLIDQQLEELKLQQNQDILNELQDYKLQVQQKIKNIDTSSKFKQYYQNNQKIKDEKTQIKIQAIQKMNKTYENSFDVITDPRTIQNQMDIVRTKIQKKKKQDYLDQLKLTNSNLVNPNLTTAIQIKDEVTQYSDMVTQMQEDEPEDNFQKKEVQQSFYKTDQQFNTVKTRQFQDAELALSKLNQRSPNKYHDSKSFSSKLIKNAQDDRNLKKQQQFNEYLNKKLKNVKEINRYFQIQPEIDQKQKDIESKQKEIQFKNVYFGRQSIENRDETSLKQIFKSELRNLQKDQTLESKIEPQKNNNMSIDEGNHMNSLNDSIADTERQKFESPQYSVFLLNQNLNDSYQGMQISETAMKSQNTSKINKYFKIQKPQNKFIQADQFPKINQEKQLKIQFNIQQSQDFFNFQNFKSNQSNTQFDYKINLQNQSSNEFSMQQNQLFLNNVSPAQSQYLIPKNIIKKAIRTRNQMKINQSQNEGMKTLGEIKIKLQLEQMNEIKQKYVNHESSLIENAKTKVSNDFKYSVSQLNSSENVTSHKLESNIRRFNQFLPQNLILTSPNNKKPIDKNEFSSKEMKRDMHSLSLNVNDRSVKQSNQFIQNQKNEIEQKIEKIQMVFQRNKNIKNNDIQQKSGGNHIVHTIPSVDEKKDSQNKLETETYND